MNGGKTRLDGRYMNQLRALSADISCLSNTDGSSKYSQGKSSLIVGIFGPGVSKSVKREKATEATIEVSVRRIQVNSQSSSGSGSLDRDYEQFVKKTFENYIILENYPRSLIHIVIQILENDGGILSCLINGTALAIMNCGIDMYAIPIGVSLGYNNNVQENKKNTNINSSNGKDNGTLVIDPTQEEEETCDFLVNLVINSISQKVDMVEGLGLIEEDALQYCIEEGVKVSFALLAFLQLSLKKDLQSGIK